MTPFDFKTRNMVRSMTFAPNNFYIFTMLNKKLMTVEWLKCQTQKIIVVFNGSIFGLLTMTQKQQRTSHSMISHENSHSFDMLVNKNKN